MPNGTTLQSGSPQPSGGGDTPNRTRWFLGGMTGGAAVGFATAGPPGMIGGAIGGAVLGPALQWWRGLPSTERFVNPPPPPVDVPAVPPPPVAVPHIPPPRPAAILPPPRQAPRAVRQPSAVPKAVHAAAAAASVPRAVIPPPPPPPPMPPPTTIVMPRHAALVITPHLLSNTRTGLRSLVRVAPRDEQACHQRLDALIALAAPAGNTSLRYYRDPHGAQPLTPDTVLPRGAHTIYYRIVRPQEIGGMSSTMLDVQPTIEQLMGAMNFRRRGWRWELAWGHAAYGARILPCHLTVPDAMMWLPVNMQNIDAILAGLFPLGSALNGTHMSIECSMSRKMNNAASFLNGSAKGAQGYRADENADLIRLCEIRLAQWRAQRRATLIHALAQF